MAAAAKKSSTELLIDYKYIDLESILDAPETLSRAQKQEQRTVQHKRRTRNKTGVGNLIFLQAALIVTCIALIGYIRLESSITTSVKQIAKLESTLNTLKLENDETMDRIQKGIDLDEIRRIAVTELGMVQASDGQVVSIPGSGNDYVRQYSRVATNAPIDDIDPFRATIDVRKLEE